MKYLFLCSIVTLLTGCIGSTGTNTSLTMQLRNPLFAERYYDEQVDHMVSLEIQNDPLATAEDKKEIIDEVRVASLKKAKDAEARQKEGMVGIIKSDFEYAVGEALLLDNTLFLGPTFETIPGPSLEVYVSTIHDPREGTFPDASAQNLGPLQTPYGAQSFPVPAPKSTEPADQFRTFVLWDSDLERIYGFAQLTQ